MAAIALARPHLRARAAGASLRDTRDCGCGALFFKSQRRVSSLLPHSPLSAGPGSGRRHFPEEFAQPADLGTDYFAKQSAAEVERTFPAMVRAGTPLAASSMADSGIPIAPPRRLTCHAHAEGMELFSMDVGPTSGRRVRPSVASPNYEPHWMNTLRKTR